MLVEVKFRVTTEMPWLDVEARLEAGLPLGAGDVTELTWKDHLDGYTCTECGRCEAECPASRTGKPLSPKLVILDLKRYLLERGPALLPAGAAQLPSPGRPEDTRPTAQVALWHPIGRSRRAKWIHHPV